MDRRQFLIYAAAALGLPRCLKFPSHIRSGAERPNIILILTDDLGYGDLGCYGQSLMATPNLDQMAAEGLRFTQAYSAAPVCAPSRWGLMTGRHIGHAPTARNQALLTPNDVTIADVLKATGYATIGVGKWALGHPYSTGMPTDRGFDNWFGFYHQRYAYVHYPHYLWRNRGQMFLRENFAGKQAYAHDLFTNEVLTMLGQLTAPYFVYLPYTLPHTNNELFEATGNGLEVPDCVYDKWTEAQNDYASMVYRIDRDVGRILDAVRGANTLVIFTSDNGPNMEAEDLSIFNSSGGLRGAKHSLYEGGTRIPLIAWWPERIAPGVTDHVCALYDLLATFADLAGVEAPPGDGLSLAPLLGGDPQADHTALYWKYEGPDMVLWEAARAGNWKALRIGDAIELYDLGSDLGETVDLSRAYPGFAEELLTLASAPRRAYLSYVVR